MRTSQSQYEIQSKIHPTNIQRERPEKLPEGTWNTLVCSFAQDKDIIVSFTYILNKGYHEDGRLQQNAGWAVQGPSMACSDGNTTGPTRGGRPFWCVHCLLLLFSGLGPWLLVREPFNLPFCNCVPCSISLFFIYMYQIPFNKRNDESHHP